MFRERLLISSKTFLSAGKGSKNTIDVNGGVGLKMLETSQSSSDSNAFNSELETLRWQQHSYLGNLCSERVRPILLNATI